MVWCGTGILYNYQEGGRSYGQSCWYPLLGILRGQGDPNSHCLAIFWGHLFFHYFRSSFRLMESLYESYGGQLVGGHCCWDRNFAGVTFTGSLCHAGRGHLSPHCCHGWSRQLSSRLEVTLSSKRNASLVKVLIRLFDSTNGRYKWLSTRKKTNNSDFFF